MKALLLYFLFTIMVNVLFAQSPLIDNKYELNFADVYVLKVKFSKRLLEKKSYCVYKKGTICFLYQVKVIDVLYCPHNTVYDSISMMQLGYLIAPIAYGDSVKETQELYITAMPSSTPKYLALTRMLPGNISERTEFYHRYAYLSGLINCKKKKKDLFENFIDAQ